MWHKSEEIDFESLQNNDPDYPKWSDDLRDESEMAQIEPKTGILEDFTPNADKTTPTANDC